MISQMKTKTMPRKIARKHTGIYLFIYLMFLNTCCSSPFVLALVVKYAYICFSVHFWKLALRFSAFVDDLGSAGY